MKIIEVNTYFVRPRWGFVEIVTDDGLTGWGEPVLEGHCSTVLACVQEMKPYLIGKDPMRIEDFSAVLYRAGFYRGGGVLMSAISGIDQALWDIKGKFFGTPVYQRARRAYGNRAVSTAVRFSGGIAKADTSVSAFWYSRRESNP